MVHQPESAATLVALSRSASAIQAGRAWSRCWMRCRCRCVRGFHTATPVNLVQAKSTLLNIIGLLMPPSSGGELSGRPVSFWSGAEVAQRAAGSAYWLCVSAVQFDSHHCPCWSTCAGLVRGWRRLPGGAKSTTCWIPGHLPTKAGQQHITPSTLVEGMLRCPSVLQLMPHWLSFITSVHISGRGMEWHIEKLRFVIRPNICMLSNCWDISK